MTDRKKSQAKIAWDKGVRRSLPVVRGVRHVVAELATPDGHGLRHDANELPPEMRGIDAIPTARSRVRDQVEDSDAQTPGGKRHESGMLTYCAPR